MQTVALLWKQIFLHSCFCCKTMSR